MKNASLVITIDMFDTSEKTSRSCNLKPEDYFDEETLVSGEDAVFGTCREWEIYRLSKDFEEFDSFKISIFDPKFNLTYVQKITYWNTLRNKLHLCHFFKGSEEVMKERQMILTQVFENDRYLINRFIWEEEMWRPDGDAVLGNVTSQAP
jgi:hypothetical protein